MIGQAARVVNPDVAYARELLFFDCGNDAPILYQGGRGVSFLP
jgi:hypothetical protein